MIIISFMINSMHSDKTIGIFGVEYFNLGTQFNHFQVMSALISIFLCYRSYPEKLEEFIPTFHKIRYILE